MRRHATWVVLYLLVLSARADYGLSLENEDGDQFLLRDERSTKGYSKGKTKNDDLHIAMAKNKEMKERLSELWLPSVHKIWRYWHKSGARKAMGAIATSLLQHAGKEIARHVRSVIRSSLRHRDLVEIPAQPFVNAPPAGPMETLSIDIKGDASTYKNFSKVHTTNEDEDLFTPSKVVSRSLEKYALPGVTHGYLRNAITGAEEANNDTTTTNAETKSYESEDEDASGESGDEDDDDKGTESYKSEERVETQPKKKRKNKHLKDLVKESETSAKADSSTDSTLPDAPKSAASSTAGTTTYAPSTPSNEPSAVANPSTSGSSSNEPAISPAGPSIHTSSVGNGNVVGLAGASTATTTQKPKQKKKKKKNKKHNKNKYKVYSEAASNNNSTTKDTNTTSNSTSILPTWAQNLRNWSKEMSDELAAKPKPNFDAVKTAPELKKGEKGLTLVHLGGSGSTELPPLTPPSINPLLNDSGDVDPHKEKTAPLVDDDADDEGELPPKANSVKVVAAAAPSPAPAATAESSPEHDPLKATHAGDEGIDHDTPQESLKGGHEQGPLPPGHEQGPKLPGHEKGPLLPGQIHAGNFTAQDSEEGDALEGPSPPSAAGTNPQPSVIDDTMAGGHCSPCLGEHGLGVPVVFDQDGSLHCQPCHGGGHAGVGMGGEGPSMASTLKEQYLHDKWNGPNGHGNPPSDTHEPFQLLLPADPSGPPPSNELPFNPPPHPLTPLVDESPPQPRPSSLNLPPPPPQVPPPIDSMSITHDEFEKMGQHMNPELLSVIEKNNHKISALWNEVKDVQSRLGNIESVVQVVEKAVQRIETKLDTSDENSAGVFVDDPVHQKTLKIKLPSPSIRNPPDLPLYPPNIGDYRDSHITEGFPHASHHSPVLKQYFIPLQPVGGKEIRPDTSNNGLPYSVNKFLSFLMGELQRDRSRNISPAELALQLQNMPIPARVPHVPLPQPDLPYPPKEHDIDRLEYEIGRLPKKFAPKVLHPELDDQPAICPCENGGQCINGRSDCDCPIRYTGIRCEKPVPRSPLLDSIIDDLPPETQNEIRGGPRGSAGMITLPLVIAADKEMEEPDQKVIAETSPSKVVSNLLSQFFTPEYLQKFAKRHKVNVRRRYVKYPAEKQK